jgi:hypothetical protein
MHTILTAIQELDNLLFGLLKWVIESIADDSLLAPAYLSSLHFLTLVTLPFSFETFHIVNIFVGAHLKVLNFHFESFSIELIFDLFHPDMRFSLLVFIEKALALLLNDELLYVEES